MHGGIGLGKEMKPCTYYAIVKVKQNNTNKDVSVSREQQPNERQLYDIATIKLP